MKSKVKYLALAGLIAFVGLFTGINAHHASAAFNPDAEKGGCPTTSLYKTQSSKWTDGKKPKNLAECNVLPDEKGRSLMDTMTTVINVIVGCVGIIAVAVIVIGGITFATSQGDTAKTAKAKNTILFGVVGLVVALLAFAIVNFVLSGVFGGTTTDEAFVLPASGDQPSQIG